MANVIDSLVVQLGLDNTVFKKKLKDSENAQKDFDTKTKSMNKKQTEAERKEEQQKEKFHKMQLERNKQVLEGFTRLRNETLAFLAVFTAGKGILDFAEDTITSVSALGRLSDNLGVGIHELGGWELAMKKVGGTAADATELVTKAGEAAGAYKLGLMNQTSTGLLTMAGGVGVNLDPAKNLKNAKSVMMAMNDVIHAWYAKDPTMAYTMAKKFLSVNDAQFNLLKMTHAELQKKLATDAQIAGLNERQRKLAEQAEENWSNLSERLKSVGRTVVTELSPAILKMLDRLATFLSDKKNIDALSASLIKIATAINNINIKDFTDQASSGFTILLDVLKLVLVVLKGIKDTGESIGILAGALTTGTNPLKVTGQLGAAQNMGISGDTAMDAAFMAKYGGVQPASQSSKVISNTFYVTAKDDHSIVHKIENIFTRQANSGVGN